jgi:hypothetical protein
MGSPAAHCALFLLLALALALLGTSCGRRLEPRAAPPLTRRSAIALASAALRLTGGIESPRAIAAELPPPAGCAESRPERRVDCYRAGARAPVATRAIPGGWQISFELPHLSDHVHHVLVVRRAGRIEIAIRSIN